VSAELLAQWESAAEEKANAAGLSSLRGQRSQFTDEQIAFVNASWRAYSEKRRKVRFQAFMKKLRAAWKDTNWLLPCPSTKTVQDMLLANGIRLPQAKKVSLPSSEKIKRYFPNAQVLLDGKEVEVLYKDQVYHFCLEFSKDLACDQIGAEAVGLTEDYHLVKEAFTRHCQEHGLPLAALVDNRSANRPLEIELGKYGRILIYARPYRPQSRGPIEQEFGLFEKTLSRIEIKGQSDQEIAMSIVDVLARMYLRLRNQTPRCSTCPMTPEKLMQYQPSELESQRAYQALTRERERRREQQERALKISAEQAELIEGIVKEQRLTGDRLLLKKSLRHVELAAIREAERRFFVASQKDTFDPAKRSMAYFCRIAFNVQKERDRQRREQIARRRYGLDQAARKVRSERQSEIERRRAQQHQQRHPHEAMRQSFEVYRALPESFRAHTGLWKPLLDRAAEAIMRHRNHGHRQQLIDRVRLTILAQSQARLELRYEFLNLIEKRLQELGLNIAKSVTPN